MQYPTYLKKCLKPGILDEWKVCVLRFCFTFLNQNVGFEHSIAQSEYLETLQNTLLPQLDGDYVFQQDGAPPHWALDVRTYLNQQLPGRWIGRAAERDQTMMKWPPRSPDLTPLDFYFWGYVKGKVYVPPLAQTIDQLKIRIRAAIQTVTIDVLIKVWANMDRRLQKVIRTKGRHLKNMRI